MKNTEYPEPGKFSPRLSESRTRAKKVPRELLELQDYLKQLSEYVDKYGRIRGNLVRQNAGVLAASEGGGKCWGRRDFRSREMGFAVKEEVGQSSPVQVIEMAPAEEVVVISGNGRRTRSGGEDEKEPSATGLDPDDSRIGIYFIEHVVPVNFVNVLERELSTLGNIFPDVSDIVEQITREFEHFKKDDWALRNLCTKQSHNSCVYPYLRKNKPPVYVIITGALWVVMPCKTAHGCPLDCTRKYRISSIACQKCLEKVSPLLPDILKELQELIKFVKKKRNEPYVWPDDSDYLRKTSEALPKPFGNQVEGRKIRHETVGFLTVLTNTPPIIRECEAGVTGEPRASQQSERVRKCSMRVSNREQLTLLQPKIQSNLTYFEKAETAEATRNGFGENSLLTEFSTSQVLETLLPGPVFQIVLQYRVRGNIEYLVNGVGSGEDRSDKILALTEIEKGGFRKFRGLGSSEPTVTAETALRKACFELRTESHSNRETANESDTGVGDLRSLMLEVHKNQIALSRVLLEKEVLNPAIIALTDPRVLREEKEGVRLARLTLGEADLDNPRREDVQRLIDGLRSKCEAKNRLIMSLLKGLRSNVPCEHWQELTTGVIRDLERGVQSQAEEGGDFFGRSSLTRGERENVFRCQVWNACITRQSGVEEIVSERETARGTYHLGRNPAKISYSEVLSNKSESSCTADEVRDWEPLPETRSFTEKPFNVETEKLFKDLENEVNSLTFEHNKILCEIEGLRRRKSLAGEEREDNKTLGSGSKTINLTIKIGDQDSMSGYHSALSIVPSGASLKEKKPELSFPANTGEVPRAPAAKCSVHEFKSALNLSKDELVRRYYGCGKSTKSFTNFVLKLKLPVFLKDEDAEPVPEGILRDAAEEKLENRMPVGPDSGATYATAKHSVPTSERVSCYYYPGGHFHGDVPPNEGMSDSRTEKESAVSEFSELHPQMNILCEQSQKMEKLKSRLRFLERDLRCLRMTIDRMDILTEKLEDDARESSENFKYVCDVFRFITSQLSI